MVNAVGTGRFRGRYFEGLQETECSQTAVMTIGPGQDAGPDETHAGDQIIFIVASARSARARCTISPVAAPPTRPATA